MINGTHKTQTFSTRSTSSTIALTTLRGNFVRELGKASTLYRNSAGELCKVASTVQESISIRFRVEHHSALG